MGLAREKRNIFFLSSKEKGKEEARWQFDLYNP